MSTFMPKMVLKFGDLLLPSSLLQTLCCFFVSQTPYLHHDEYDNVNQAFLRMIWAWWLKELNIVTQQLQQYLYVLIRSFDKNFEVHMSISIRKLVCLDGELLILYFIQCVMMNVEKTFIEWLHLLLLRCAPLKVKIVFFFNKLKTT